MYFFFFFFVLVDRQSRKWSLELQRGGTPTSHSNKPIPAPRKVKTDTGSSHTEEEEEHQLGGGGGKKNTKKKCPVLTPHRNERKKSLQT